LNLIPPNVKKLLFLYLIPADICFNQTMQDSDGSHEDGGGKDNAGENSCFMQIKYHDL
jgi:hypothetical protein